MQTGFGVCAGATLRRSPTRPHATEQYKHTYTDSCDGSAVLPTTSFPLSRRRR